MQENGFIQKKARSKQYPAETFTDADELALFVHTPA